MISRSVVLACFSFPVTVITSAYPFPYLMNPTQRYKGIFEPQTILNKWRKCAIVKLNWYKYIIKKTAKLKYIKAHVQNHILTICTVLPHQTTGNDLTSFSNIFSLSNSEDKRNFQVPILSDPLSCFMTFCLDTAGPCFTIYKTIPVRFTIGPITLFKYFRRRKDDISILSLYSMWFRRSHASLLLMSLVI